MDSSTQRIWAPTDAIFRFHFLRKDCGNAGALALRSKIEIHPSCSLTQMRTKCATQRGALVRCARKKHSACGMTHLQEFLIFTDWPALIFWAI